MTPEEFLAQQEALRSLSSAMHPLYSIVATMRRGFIDEGGLGETAADEMVVAWFREVGFPLMRPQPTPEAA